MAAPGVPGSPLTASGSASGPRNPAPPPRKSVRARRNSPRVLLRTEFPEPLLDLEGKLEKQGHWEGQLVHTTRAGTRLTIT